MMPEPFYTNKELYEKFDARIGELSDELKDTTSAVKKYNGLHERFDEMDKKLDTQIKRCDQVQTTFNTKKDITSTLLRLWPIIISTIIFILSMIDII